MACRSCARSHGTGILEGGSFAFINPKTAVIGISSRVNEEGARQLEEVLKVQGIELIRVHLTGYRLHIDGNFVMIDVDTAIINPTQLPFTFLERLKELKIWHHRGLLPTIRSGRSTAWPCGRAVS